MSRGLAVIHNLFLLGIPAHLPPHAQGDIGQMASRRRAMGVFHIGNGPLSRLDAIEKIPDVRVKQRVRRALDASLCPELRAAAWTPLGTAGRVSPERRDLVFRRRLFISEHLVTAARERHAAPRAEELEALALAPSLARLAD